MDWSRKKRFYLGILLLLLVDVIWVGSSELSEYIFNEIGYDKPFFSTYLKTSMFTLYLLGFLFWKPWRHQCFFRVKKNYQVVDVCEEDIEREETSSLGESSYEPVNLSESEKCSDAESEDGSNKSVRFSKMAEVRHMSESEAIEAMLSRLSFTASIRAEQFARDISNKFPVKTVMRISLVFCLLWFLGNYGYQLALSDTEAGVVNVVSSTSGLFTLILAALFPSSPADKFTLSKLVAVILMVTGTTLISLEDLKVEESSLPVGVIWSLVSALMYACYMVFLKRKVPSEEKMDLCMFFGFVGLFNTILLWPGFFLFNATGWEAFEMPNKQQFLFIIINGLIGTVFSELLWLWGCYLTSSLMATLSLTLTIPLSMAFDIVLKGVDYSWQFYLGSIPIVASFVIITLLTHFEDRDPLLDVFKFLCKACFSRRKDYRLISLDSNEEESLIVDEQFCNEVIVNDEIET